VLNQAHIFYIQASSRHYFGSRAVTGARARAAGFVFVFVFVGVFVDLVGFFRPPPSDGCGLDGLDTLPGAASFDALDGL
jgi:hypothetical protein